MSEIEGFDKINNHDLLYIVFCKRDILYNLKYNCITKDIEDIIDKVLYYQINTRKWFNLIKRNTVFPIKFYRKYNRTYYRLKNRYINKEETPIMIF